MDIDSLNKKSFGDYIKKMNPDLGFDRTKANLNFIDLKFSRSEKYLENRFQEEYFKSNINHIRNCHFYTILFYLLAGFVDYYLFPKDLLPFLAIRFLVISIFIFGYF